jgi:hypothetical protein
MEDVVSPEVHRYVLAEGAVRVTEPPSHDVVGEPAVIVVEGRDKAVRVTGAETSVQPSGLITVTEKVPLLFTVRVDVVSPVLHKYVLPPDAVRTSPAQRLTVPDGATEAVGRALTVAVTGADVALQPFTSVTVTL